MLPRRTSKFSGRDETRKYRGEERANSLADFHLDNQIPPPPRCDNTLPRELKITYK